MQNVRKLESENHNSQFLIRYMPKRTRQEKMAAQLRRLQSLQQTQGAPSTTISLENITKDQSAETQVLTQPRTPVRPDVMDYTYVFSDLRKTLIFATAAIIFELALSWAVIHVNLPFLKFL